LAAKCGALKILSVECFSNLHSVSTCSVADIYLTFGGTCLKDAWWLYIGRLLVGCGIGLLSYVVTFRDVLFVIIAIKTMFSCQKITDEYFPWCNRYRFI